MVCLTAVRSVVRRKIHNVNMPHSALTTTSLKPAMASELIEIPQSLQPAFHFLAARFLLSLSQFLIEHVLHELDAGAIACFRSMLFDAFPQIGIDLDALNISRLAARSCRAQAPRRIL